MREKKGISLMVGTLILIVLVIAVAVLVYTFARSFIQDEVIIEGRNADLVWEDVHFRASYTNGELCFSNDGSIPINSVELRLLNEGEYITITEDELTGWQPLGAGEGNCFTYIFSEDYETIIVVPILDALTGEGEPTEYECDNELCVTEVVVEDSDFCYKYDFNCDGDTNYADYSIVAGHYFYLVIGNVENHSEYLQNYVDLSCSNLEKFYDKTVFGDDEKLSFAELNSFISDILNCYDTSININCYYMDFNCNDGVSVDDLMDTVIGDYIYMVKNNVDDEVAYLTGKYGTFSCSKLEDFYKETVFNETNSDYGGTGDGQLDFEEINNVIQDFIDNECEGAVVGGGCIDSDAALPDLWPYLTYGNITANGVLRLDQCMIGTQGVSHCGPGDTGCLLRERICEGDTGSYEDYSCPSGYCQLGKCLEEAPPTTLECNPNSIIGDISGNEVIDNGDFQLMFNVVRGTYGIPDNYCCYDSNDDGIFNITDANNILNYHAGLYDHETIGTRCKDPVATGVVNSLAPMTGTPCFDFQEDLVPNPVPAYSSISDIAYEVLFLDGELEGDYYDITSSGGSAWNGLDYFCSYGTGLNPELISMGDRFYVYDF